MPSSGRSTPEFYLDLFRGTRIRSLETRKLLLCAASFERVERDFCTKFGSNYRQKRIAVLASKSVQHFLGVLRLFLYEAGISPTYYVGQYDGILAEGLEPSSGLYEFAPELLLVFPAADDVKSFPPLFASADAVQQWVETQADIYLQLWRTIGRVAPRCLVLHALFVLPPMRQLGNLESSYQFSRTNCLRALNARLLEQRPPNVALVDMDYFAASFGRNEWHDQVAYFVSKQPFSLKATPLVSAFLARLIATATGDIKKCLVLDLDNTLWGGVVADDGLGGINIDPTNPVGEAYLAFQGYLRTLRERGVMLAVCSKNDDATARAPFLQHPDMILKLDDFVAFVANWDDKITNIRTIARQLNIGIDTIVFFDDNPAERMLVEQFEPAVYVINVPEDPALFVRALDNSFCFEWLHLSHEDIVRVESYTQNKKREDLAQRFQDYDSYLRSLDMEAWVEESNDQSLARICQLINKTNQFNLRTRRYAEAEIGLMRENREHALIHVRFKDQFTNYGIIASVIVRYLEDGNAFIENWVMSCRSFERGIEAATVNAIVSHATRRGCSWLYGEYVPTAKNGYVASLFLDLGFAEVSDSERSEYLQGEGALYRVALAGYRQRKHFLHVHETLS